MTPVPGPVARVADLMSTFHPVWFLCGGWAIEAWSGHRTHDHTDVDIAVFQEDQRAVFEHLGGWQLIGHDDHVADSTEPWDGRRLDLPAHIHARSQDGFSLEVLLNERSSRDWILNREPRITMPLPRCAQLSAWSLPTVVPEILLFYKATAYFGDEEMMNRRPHDELDFVALLPNLSEERCAWLRHAISLVQPGHPWLPHISV
jgi:hypothetical protein